MGVGIAMGAADIVPGVSGGTVALVLGVYQRLLAALASFDGQLLRSVRRGAWADAWRRVDGRFLLLLGTGIAVGVKALAGVMTYLLTKHQSLTFAAFFGLILASGVLVARMSRPGTPLKATRCVAAGLLAALFAVWLMSQGRLTPLAGLPYVFACGAIAICAMILPGISGAYLLLILGQYERVSGIVHRLPAFATVDDLLTLVAFAAGCLTGLLTFSRLLRWLLARYWSVTMATLAGFMVGSLYRVWPFQADATPEIEEFKQKIFQPVLPDAFGGTEAACLMVAVGCFVGVLVVDALARRQPESELPA